VQSREACWERRGGGEAGGDEDGTGDKDGTMPTTKKARSRIGGTIHPLQRSQKRRASGSPMKRRSGSGTRDEVVWSQPEWTGRAFMTPSPGAAAAALYSCQAGGGLHKATFPQGKGP